MASDEAVDEDGRDETQTAGIGVVPVPAAVGDRTPVRPYESQPGGISITKVSRGKRIRTSDLPIPIHGVCVRDSSSPPRPTIGAVEPMDSPIPVNFHCTTAPRSCVIEVD